MRQFAMIDVVSQEEVAIPLRIRRSVAGPGIKKRAGRGPRRLCGRSRMKYSGVRLIGPFTNINQVSRLRGEILCRVGDGARPIPRVTDGGAAGGR
ncbi:hypothetical protein EVAR_45598_1 [Eumeta japonica]|uniref:Uncharacterized protein n=1 Tax=Eumeta variegata TaxID=151549 RepID=A0A4C1YXJ7_EUMVA|nr:hypothetical protein EVAR_45598_1 [Eumeta japonica]